MPPRRKPKPILARRALPPEVPETAPQPAPPPAVAGDEDLLPEDLQKMLQAAYT